MTTYVPAQSHLLDWAKATFPDIRICTKLPADLAGVLPCVRINVNHSTVDKLVFESGSFDFDVFDADTVSVRNTTYRVITALTQDLPGQMVGPAFFQDVSATDLGETPWVDPNTSRRTVNVTARLHTRSLA